MNYKLILFFSLINANEKLSAVEELIIEIKIIKRTAITII